MLCGSWCKVIEAFSSSPHLRAACNVILVLILRDGHCILFLLKLYLCYRKQKTDKQTNNQTDTILVIPKTLYCIKKGLDVKK